MITDEDLRAAAADLADRFGAPRAEGFGRALPGLVDELAERWGLRLSQRLTSGATSVVLAGERAGTPVVLKLSPDAEFLNRQADMLRTLGPTGRVPAVLEQEGLEQDGPEGGAVLMERILPGTTIDAGPVPAPRDWADLTGDLHRPSPGPGAVTDRLEDRCAEMEERIGARQARPDVRRHVPDRLWRAAMEECRELVTSCPDPVVIHGDLHLGNVLAGGPRGLVAIDPKLCVGDRCFDLVDYVVVEGDADDMVERARRLAPLVGTDPDRLLAWSRVNAVVTAVSRTAWRGFDDRCARLLALAGPDLG